MTDGGRVITSAHDSLDASAPRKAAVRRLREERAELLARISQLDADMTAMFEASRDSNADDEHDPEGQTIAYERSQLSALTAHARAQLAEVESALERVDAGAYGVCEVCGKPIAAGRLEARPTARTCVEHTSTAGRRPR
ncbi:TraR/DksA family transcriptional regulator [Knoellia sp. CPCC 206435]|uniref:TraR/DksA family transcriptional regulator n=1 Tax=Knoellia terrae TaxID=3404797 RepID=UPI003B4390AA